MRNSLTTRITRNRWITRKPWVTRITTRDRWITRKPWTMRSVRDRWMMRKPWTTRIMRNRWIARKPWLTRNGWMALAGAGMLSAGLMYYFDPARGRRRRNLLSDKTAHAGHKLQTGISKAGRDIRNRTRGALASCGRKLFRFRMTENDVLTERVRSQLGRTVSHPGSIEVMAQEGRVTLSGPVLAQEAEQLIRQVHSVHGVSEIENRLDVYDEPGQIPGLQGSAVRIAGERGGFRQSNWTPAIRTIAGLTGGGALIYGASRRGSVGVAAAVAGSLLLARSVTNLDLRRLTGIGARRRAIDVRKTIHINAPASRVFGVWADFENFPTFMRHVRNVRRLDDGREKAHWRWTVDGPAGTEVQFDAVISAFEADRLLAWRTESTSKIQHAGRIQLTENADGSTTVEINMTYNPIAGALGHAVARVFGADPKHQMNDDLLRMKSYIETGKPPHDAAMRPQRGQQPEATPAPGPGALH